MPVDTTIKAAVEDQAERRLTRAETTESARDIRESEIIGCGPYRRSRRQILGSEYELVMLYGTDDIGAQFLSAAEGLDGRLA